MTEETLTGIDRVRLALAMADAGYPVPGVDLEDAEELLRAYDRLSANGEEPE